jgi:cytochrome c oxidase cbb3-type subunit III
MSSPCLRNRHGLAAIMLLGAAAVLAACSEEPTESKNDTPLQNTGAGDVAVSALFPGGGKAPPLDQQAKSFEGNAQAISEGEHLFTWYNCSGCHFHGAGGIGPALMDNKWIYGDRIDQIYASIAQGRPNGMPSWGAKLPPDQIWMLAAYVKSLPAKADKMPIPKEPPPAVPGPASLETAPDSATR